MNLRREFGGSSGQKRLSGEGLAVPVAYAVPKFTTLSAAKKSAMRQKQQEKRSTNPRKDGEFSIADLFLTDG